MLVSGDATHPKIRGPNPSNEAGGRAQALSSQALGVGFASGLFDCWLMAQDGHKELGTGT